MVPCECKNVLFHKCFVHIIATKRKRQKNIDSFLDFFRLKSLITNEMHELITFLIEKVNSFADQLEKQNKVSHSQITCMVAAIEPK